MFWTEDTDRNKEFVVPDEIVDINYKLECKTLPIDHAQALSDEIHSALPWFGNEELAGLHLIHVAESGNGWMRPEDPENEVLCLSKRTRMTLRVPQHRLEDAHQLTGQSLNIDGHPLTVKEGSPRKLSVLPTMFARYVLTEEHLDEHAFLQQMVKTLTEIDIPVTKIMAGRLHKMRMREGELFARSLMVAEMTPENAFKLQKHGIGEGRKFGCGLFVPQKGISAVNADQ
ncbi:MAG: type I-MYXAN CRISPR-associated protein Cas6/Cmx6 [Thioalkalispiraceae bacterium]|jgi:CRISPR-associated protein Cas6